MAGVRDPAFWKRFSVAVHLDEEKGPREAEDPNSWLYRETNKTRSRRWICPIFWLCFFILVPGTVAVVVWLIHTGVIGGNTAPAPGSGTTSTTGTSSADS